MPILSGYLLLTGGTGLLGRYLIKDLLDRKVKLAVLVRGSKRETANERIEAILQHWEKVLGRLLPRPVVIEGDILQPLLGVSPDDQQWISRNCTAVMHSAASLEFHADGKGEPWNTNFGGTKNMLDLCKAVGIAELHYVSTAYVCGVRDGLIRETELDCGQKFRNDYEESKLKAEQLVRQTNWIDELTVYRPAVIAGDSVTGYTNTYHGIYLYLRLMAMVVPRFPPGPDGVRRTELRVPSNGEERRNVVPVDWVSEVMTDLYMNRSAHGQTFHLAPEVGLTPRHIIDAGYAYYNSTGVQYVSRDQLDPATYNSLEAEILPSMAMYTNYEKTDPTFDQTNRIRFAPHLPCPEIDKDMLQRFLRYGEEDRWGKRKSPKVECDWLVHEYFSQMSSAAIVEDDGIRMKVSIDLMGPGGGQWTFGLKFDGGLVCTPGLLQDESLVVRMTTSEFRELMDDAERKPSQIIVDQLFPVSVAVNTASSKPQMSRERVH